MRKILYLIIASISLTSCWVEEYPEMNKTYYAKNNYDDIESVLKNTTQMVGSAEKIDQWLKANEQEKKLIEDAYFSNYNIQQKGNIITLTYVSSYDSWSANRLYNTGGKGLYDADSHWVLATLMDTLDIKCVSDQQLKLTCRDDMISNNHYSYSYNFDLTYTKSEFEKQYKIKGTGNVRYGSSNTYSNTDYAITDDVVVTTDFKQNESYLYSVSVHKGEIEFSWESSEDKAQAKIVSKNRYIISYKGFTENWPIVMRD